MSVNNTPFIGAHYSVSNGFVGAFSDAHRDEATALQFFAKSPMQAKYRSVHENEAHDVATLPFRDTIGCAVIHTSYLINLAKPETADSFSLRSIAEDLRNTHALGGQGTVVHMGKSLARNLGDAYDTYYDNILTILKLTKEISTPLLIENTAGQGTEMGYDIEAYAKFLHRFKGNTRVRSCIDTAHLFGGGSDLAGDPSGVAHKLIDLLGVGFISCIHLNDAKKELASRVDRHEDIGHGTISEASLAKFSRELYHADPHISFILETPQSHSTYRGQIAIVKNWFK